MKKDIETGATLRLGRCLFPFLLLLAPILGCVYFPLRHPTGDDREGAKYDVRTIGDITTVANAEPIMVAGVGLVTGLEGTGGDAPSDYRAMLEEQLRKQGTEDPKQLMASRDNALVVVTAQIPPGVRKGHALDVNVTLPPDSRTSSLRGGILKECVLYNMGRPLASAAGPVVVGFGEGDEATRLKQGCIWGGGCCNADRNLLLVLDENQQFDVVAREVTAWLQTQSPPPLPGNLSYLVDAKVTAQIADRINKTLHGPDDSEHCGELARVVPLSATLQKSATSRSNLIVSLDVPPQYRRNMPRYLRVARLIPLALQAESQNRRMSGSRLSTLSAQLGTYGRRLEEDLLDPARTVTASLRLEALGSESIPALKRGLTSACPLVRFCSAEALAYLGNPASGEELARTVEKQPALRAFGLTALAALDEGIAQVKLRDLLAAHEPVVRYGAFGALRTLNEHDPLVRGEKLNNTFWLHCVAADSEPLIHLSTSRRTEIVLFGKAPALQPPLSLRAGEFAVTDAAEDGHCSVSRITRRRGVTSRKCSLQLEDILRAMADLGCTYAEVVELLQQACACHSLSCALAIDALPQATPVDELVKAGKALKTGGPTDQQLVKPDEARRTDAPTDLFDKSPSSPSQLSTDTK